MSQPYEGLSTFTVIPKPTAEVLAPDQMHVYSGVLRLLLESAGVSNSGHRRETPLIELSDGTKVVIHKGAELKTIDAGDRGYLLAEPSAVLQVTGLAQTESAYVVTDEPLISHREQIYVHSGAPNTYRLANEQDEGALRVVFTDLDSHLQNQLVE